MSNLSDQKLLSGKSTVIGAAVPQLNVEALNPADHEGAFAYSSDGVMYFSDGSSWTISEIPPIRKPLALEPLNSTHHRQLRLSNFLASGGYAFTQTGVLFIASLNADLSNPFLNVLIQSTTQSSYELGLQSGPAHGQTYYWRAKYLSQDGQESAFSSRQTLVFPQLVDTPVSLITAGQESASAEVSAFYSAFGRTLAQTQWQLYANASGTGAPIALTNAISTLSTLRQTPEGLPYSWRARYKDTLGTWSAWSVLQSNIQPKLIDDPVPLTDEGAQAIALKISAYRSQAGLAYQQTQWQIFDNAQAQGTPLFAVANENSALSTKGLQAVLTMGGTYYWRARYQDAFNDLTNWTTVRSYVQPNIIDTPLPLTASNIETQTLQVAAYASGYDVAYAKTHWQIFDNAEGTGSPASTADNTSLEVSTITLPGALVRGGGYYWRARFEGGAGYLSDWSALQSYIQPLAIAMPVQVTAPDVTAIALEVGGYLSVYGTPFAQTLWQVYDNETGLGLPLSSATSTGNTISTQGLAPAGAYYWRARYKDTLGNLSSWTSLRGYTQPLAIDTPVPVTAVGSASFTLQVNGYFSGYGLAYSQTLWEVYANAAGTGVPIGAATNTSTTLNTVGVVPQSGPLYWRARFKDALGNLSGFSALRAYTQPKLIEDPVAVTLPDAYTDSVQTSLFTSNYGEAFAQSQWEVYGTSQASGTPLAAQVLTTAVTSLTTTTLTGLAGKRGYVLYWRMRYQSASGAVSAWTTLSSFTQTGGIDAPTPLGTAGAEAETLSISAYYSATGFVYQETEWQVYTTATTTGTPLLATNNTQSSLATLGLAGLNQGWTYYWRARYKTTTGQYSAWTTITSFIQPNLDMVLVYRASPFTNYTISCVLGGNVNATIYWGDGTSNTYTAPGKVSHTFAASSFTRTVRISGTLTQFGYYESLTPTAGYSTSSNTAPGVTVYGYFNTSNYALQSCTSFGAGLGLTSLKYAFYGATNLASVPSGLPSTVKNLSGMFAYCESSFTATGVENWNTANVTDMSHTFRNCGPFNQAIAPWNTANVTDMSFMFANTYGFQQPIGSWNTGKVTNMASMFERAGFNQPIGSWNTENVTNMSSMFYNLSNYNQTLDSWNTGKVTNMNSMFFGCLAFNKPLASWNTANVTDMSFMFNGAYRFNQPIEAWNTANVVNMSYMFLSCSAFNQPLGAWSMSKVTTAAQMLNGAGVSSANYGQTLIGWAAQTVKPSVSLNAGTAKYSAASASARAVLIAAPNYWTITDGGQGA
jgi:surface protein